MILLVLSCNSNSKSNRLAEEKSLMLNRNAAVCSEINTIVSGNDFNKKGVFDCKELVKYFYTNREFLPFWSDTGKAHSYALSFLNYLDTCENDGLIKDYFSINSIEKLYKKILKDSLSKKQQENWANFDVLLTNAFFNVCNDLKRGRLYTDSLSWKNDTSRFSTFFGKLASDFAKSGNSKIFFNALQPQQQDYKQLRNQLKSFLKNRDTTHYSFVDYSLLKRNDIDSLTFFNQLYKRFYEESLTDSLIILTQCPDSLFLSNSIKLWQKKHELNTDGFLTADFIKALNLTDQYKYIRLVLTLDRYKKISDSLGKYFILVNLPAYNLKFWDSDTLALYSRIVCGKQHTPTPQLKSAVKEIITMPTWTVPPGIIKKEMLPQLKKNPGYLAKKGLSLFDKNGQKLDPGSIDWTKYNKGIPYKIRQKSGTRNALGVIKFNFENDHDVYLHDTNERYLFQRNKRCLSHGCVRVEKWMELAKAIALRDSIWAGASAKMKYNTDSIVNWIENKKNHRIAIRNPIPIFIAYFSVESVEGKLVFHNDIYGEDEKLIKKYYSNWKP